MFSTDDTIVAISTALGRGAIGVVRLSGPDAAAIAQQLTGRADAFDARHATFARIAAGLECSSGGAVVSSHADAVHDQVVVTFFPGPQSYTGGDVVEISAHGSPVVLQAILRAAVAAGARLAEPGEFTLRAFLNGKLDLVQAEAVADLIAAVTPRQARTAFDQLEGTLTARLQSIEGALFDLMARLEASLDFPDEGFHFVERQAATEELAAIRGRFDALLDTARGGRLIREGAHVAIVGTPNVGKSSLFNALLATDRAIVTPIPGTTRDLLTERVDVCGIAVALVDTAGLRDAGDVVEREGVARARAAVAVADLTLVVLDRSRPVTADDRALLAETAGVRRVVVANKIDLPAAWDETPVVPLTEVSVRTGEGIDALRTDMAAALGGGEALRDHPVVSNVRHATLLERAREAVVRASDALSSSSEGASEEFVLVDLREAAEALQEITGRRSVEELLAHVFSRFCVGK